MIAYFESIHPWEGQNMNGLLKAGEALYYVEEDEHPLKYLRVNVVLQQFDEFLETYGIQEGDNMYLAPEDRIFIW